MKKTEEEWKRQLTPEQFRIARQSGTEPPFTGKYFDNKETGAYHCICCGNPVFHSEQKFDSGSGWPSYWAPINDNAITSHKDSSHGLVRTEIRCARCEAHLGHVFQDGPPPTGLRYCINSAVLEFKKT